MSVRRYKMTISSRQEPERVSFKVVKAASHSTSTTREPQTESDESWRVVSAKTRSKGDKGLARINKRLRGAIQMESISSGAMVGRRSPSS